MNKLHIIGVVFLALLLDGRLSIAQEIPPNVKYEIPEGVNPTLFENTEEPEHNDDDILDIPILMSRYNNPDFFKEAIKNEKTNIRKWKNDGNLVADFKQSILTAPIDIAVGSPSIPNSTELGIYIFQVGQADSMLVVGPAPERKTLLVDLGVSKKGNYKDGKSIKIAAQRIADIVGGTHIDYFVISHMHTDHMGQYTNGFLGLLDRVNPQFTIGTIIDIRRMGRKYGSYSKTAITFPKLVKRWKKEGKVIHRIVPKFGADQIDLGQGVSVDILAFAGKFYNGDRGVHYKYAQDFGYDYKKNPASQNDFSIAMEISLGDFEFWTAGDLSGSNGNGLKRRTGTYTNVELPLVQYWQEIERESDVEIYRANHHGSQHSSSIQLLDSLDPEFVLYSSECCHKHPNPHTVRRSAKTARQFASNLDYRIWKDGSDFPKMRGKVVGEINIHVSKSGARYTIEGECHKSYSDADEAARKDEKSEDYPIKISSGAKCF